MGNGYGKTHPVTDSRARERRKILNAQDSFVRKLVDNSGDNIDDVDGDSVGPDWIPDVDSAHRRQHEYDEIHAKALKVDITKYRFPFENIVFEGGGSKGMAYCGAIRVLEELGIWPQIKRFAGTSSGGMTASLLAVGYNSYQIEEFLSQDLSKVFLDHSCGYCSLLPNLIRRYGWNPGKKIFHWFGKALQAQTGNADITFSEVYEKYGKELCIVVTNLNMMNAEFFHPKTTPDTPVRVAVRMTMAIPALFAAKQYTTHGQDNTYVDGGVLCNYPIHCYDGWWLSMNPKDSFLTKLQPLEDLPRLYEKKERFGTYNEKTLGFLLYADSDMDILRNILEQRAGVDLPPFPDTELARERARKTKVQEKVRIEHTRNLHAVNAFLKVLKKYNTNNDDKIMRSELEKALKDERDFPKRYCERLFGQDVTIEQAMSALDKNGNGEIEYIELVHFIERTGVSLQSRFLGYQRQEINGLFSFLNTLQSSMLTNLKRVFVEERDIERTVGINTGHIGTADFTLEPADRDFAVGQGRRSTEAFLRYYVAKNNPPLKVKHGPITEAKAFNGKVTIMNNHNTKNELMLQNGKTRRSKEIFAYDNKVEPVMEAELNAADIDVQELKTSTFVLNP